MIGHGKSLPELLCQAGQSSRCVCRRGPAQTNCPMLLAGKCHGKTTMSIVHGASYGAKATYSRRPSPMFITSGRPRSVCHAYMHPGATEGELYVETRADRACISGVLHRVHCATYSLFTD